MQLNKALTTEDMLELINNGKLVEYTKFFLDSIKTGGSEHSTYPVLS